MLRSSFLAFLLAGNLCLFAYCAGESRTDEAKAGKTGAAAADRSYTVQGKPVPRPQYDAARLLDEGLLLMRSNANEEALDKFKQSISAYDGYAEAHHSLGLVHAKLGNTQEAIKELKVAVSMNPQLDESWLLLAGFYQSAGLLREAAGTYGEFLRRFPNNAMVPKVNVSLGLLYAKLGKDDQALSELRHSIEANPNLPASWITLAGIYQARGDLNNAIDTYLKFKQKFPNDQMIPRVNGLLDTLGKERARIDKEAKVGNWQQQELRRIESKSTEAPLPPESGAIAPGKDGRDDYLSSMVETLTRWPRSRIPVPVFIADGSKSRGFKDSFRGILRRSFEDWSKASLGKVSFSFVDSPARARLVCFFTDDISRLKNSAEAGEARLNQDQKYISSAELWFLTLPPGKSVSLSDNAFRLISLHEIGHALGLTGHTTNPEDIMFYSTTFKDSWRELSGRDARSITRLYQSDI